MVERAGAPEPGIQRAQQASSRARQQGDVGNPLQVLGDRPEVGVRRHPVKRVEPTQVDRTAMASQRSFAGKGRPDENGHGQVLQRG